MKESSPGGFNWVPRDPHRLYRRIRQGQVVLTVAEVGVGVLVMMIMHPWSLPPQTLAWAATAFQWVGVFGILYFAYQKTNVRLRWLKRFMINTPDNVLIPAEPGMKVVATALDSQRTQVIGTLMRFDPSVGVDQVWAHDRLWRVMPGSVKVVEQ